MLLTRVVVRSLSNALVTSSLFVAVCAQPLVARAHDGDAPSEPSREPSEEAGVRSYSGSAGVLYGGLPGASDSVNPFGVGLGLRLGVTLPQRLYFGVSYEHFFGGPPSTFANIASYETEATLDALQAWAGYQLPLEGVTLRPCLGVGAAYVQEETLTTDARGQERREESALGVVVSPTLQLIFPVGPASMLVEGRYSIVPEAVAEANGLLVGVGFGAEI